MRAVRIVEASGPEGLKVVDAEAPRPGKGQIAVKVHASALNRADLLQTLGLYPAPPGVPADIPGLEYAGEVSVVGEGVTRWRPGDRVMGLVGGGAWAGQLVTNEGEALPVPKELSLEAAAAIPEAFMTAFDAMVLQAGLAEGQSVLIHAVASGVGTAAVQIARVFGAKAIGTGRTQAKLDRVAKLGITDLLLVDRQTGKFADEVRKRSVHGVEVVLDLVGGSYLPESLKAMAPGGTLMLVGLMAGATAEVPLTAVLSKRLTIKGTTLRARSPADKAALAAQFEKQLLPHFETGKLAPVVDAVVPMTDIAKALQRVSSNETFGKLVVTW